MPLHANCPGCGKDYELQDSLRGKTVRCKRCEETFVVGGAAGGATGAPAAGRRAEAAASATGPQDEPRPARPRAAAGRDVEDDEGDRPRRRRPARDEDDDTEADRPRRRRSRRGDGPPVGLIAGIAAGVLVFLLIAGVGIWWVFSRSKGNNPGPVASSNPPPGAANPMAPNAGPQAAPNAGPQAAPNPGGQQPMPGGGGPPAVPPGAGGGGAAPNQNLVVLSNPRRGGGGIGMGGPRSGFSVNYRFTQAGGARIGSHFRVVIKDTRGDISHGDLHGILDQEGTLSFREFGFGGGLNGPCEIYMEQSDIPGRFGNWQRVSNSVTLN
jgi:predicted Zn finger-like uncharacterized protein